MKYFAFYVSIFIALLFSVSAQAQTATDLNEGFRVSKDNSTGVFTVGWWGKSGRTYFIQTSMDLVNWSYLPYVETGAEAVQGIGFTNTNNDPRRFWHLQYTDQTTGGASAADADFDNDGLSNLNEVTMGINPFNKDSDGDHFSDGEEVNNGSDPGNASSAPALGEGTEKDGYELPVYIVGNIKNVSNTWSQIIYPGMSAIEEAYVAWWDDDGHYGSEPYSSYESRWSDKYGELRYPSGINTPVNHYGFQMQASSDAGVLSGDVPGVEEHFSHANLVHYQIKIGTLDGQPQPWPVYRKLLTYKSSRPLDETSRSYSDLHYEKFRIDRDKASSSKTLLMEPTVDMGSHKDQEIGFLDISMTDWSLAKSYDNLSHTDTGTPTPWIMLPQNEAREISVWHNVGATGTLYLKAAGEGFESAPLFEVDASTPFQVSSNKLSDKGFLRVGIGNPGETTPLMTPPDEQSDLEKDYQHLVRFTVKEKKQLLVVVHPICLATLDGNGNVQPGQSPQFLPSRAEIEDYLNEVFEAQANIHVTVEMRAENHLLWDVGMGPSIPDETTLGAGDGILDCYFSASGLSTVSAEEQFIFNFEPPDSRIGINLYYVVAPNGGRYHRWLSAEDETASEMNNLVSAGFIGWAGPALLGHPSSAVFVLDHDSNQTDTPDVLWTMAHELGHGVGKLPHTCGQALEWNNPNSLKGGDNEFRLMTGRSGLKRALGPTVMIKYEWDQLNKSTLLE